MNRLFTNFPKRPHNYSIQLLYLDINSGSTKNHNTMNLNNCSRVGCIVNFQKPPPLITHYLLSPLKFLKNWNNFCIFKNYKIECTYGNACNAFGGLLNWPYGSNKIARFILHSSCDLIFFVAGVNWLMTRRDFEKWQKNRQLIWYEYSFIWFKYLKINGE